MGLCGDLGQTKKFCKYLILSNKKPLHSGLISPGEHGVRGHCRKFS